MPPAAGLELPDLPDGWVYEGWVVADEGPITTGTFTALDAVDSGNPFSGAEANAGPPIPDCLIQCNLDLFNNSARTIYNNFKKII